MSHQAQARSRIVCFPIGSTWGRARTHSGKDSHIYLNTCSLEHIHTWSEYNHLSFGNFVHHNNDLIEGEHHSKNTGGRWDITNLSVANSLLSGSDEEGRREEGAGPTRRARESFFARRDEEVGIARQEGLFLTSAGPARRPN